jgi:DNA-binding CsgD family transcriptional regulator
MQKPSLVGVVEAAYQLEGTEQEWLSGIVEAARPHLDRGRGVVGYFWEARQSGPLQVSEPVLLGTPRVYEQKFAAFTAAADDRVLDGTYRAEVVCGTVSELVGADLVRQHPAWAMLRPSGICDFLGIRVADPNGQSAFLGAPLHRLGRLRPAERTCWERIASHLSAGLRLRRALLAGASEQRGAVEAILSAKGAVVHAEGLARSRDARSVLHDAIIAMERARGRLRTTNPRLAVAIWRGLVSGRWSLVDSFESDGRRYIVARKNDPHVTDPRRLTLRERQIVAYARLGHANKLIAYELGLSTSSVATHLARALRKLGLRSRSELFRRFG